MPLDRMTMGWLLAGAGTVALAAGALLFFAAWRRQQRNGEEAERRRRARLSRVGRIAPAEILEIIVNVAAPQRHRRLSLRALAPAPGSPPQRRLAVYRYRVAGVTYETAQDLSGLEAAFRAASAGQPASVRYDPVNPSNSILAAEGWSGLVPVTSTRMQRAPNPRPHATADEKGP